MKRLTTGLALVVFMTIAPQAGGQNGVGYLPPVPSRATVAGSAVEVDAVFPIARTGWLSLINFSNDWHAPRMRKVGKRWEQIGVHEGTDIFAEPGTPVRAVVGGVIERVGWTFYSGWRVGIRDPAGRYWFYAHLQRFAPGIAVGASVRAGTSIGEVGNTGYGADPGHRNEFTYHLHLGIQSAGGTWINPYPLVRKLYNRSVKATR